MMFEYYEEPYSAVVSNLGQDDSYLSLHTTSAARILA